MFFKEIIFKKHKNKLILVKKKWWPMY